MPPCEGVKEGHRDGASCLNLSPPHTLFSQTARWQGEVQAVREGTPANEYNPYGPTGATVQLTLAISAGNLEAVMAALAVGADLEAKNNVGGGGTSGRQSPSCACVRY